MTKSTVGAGRLFLLLLLLACVSCIEQPSGLPDPGGYDGLLALGWQAIQEGDYLEAFGWFEQAIEVDAITPDAYLGAGVACIYLEDHWCIGDDYFQVAVQQDLGHSAIALHDEELQTQDTMWTVFECVDPDIPEDSLDSWLSMTADSGAVWVGQRISAYLMAGDYDMALDYRFLPEEAGGISCLDVYNVHSGSLYDCDSLVSGHVYFTAPCKMMYYGGSYPTWVMVDQSVVYDYATFDADASAGQLTRDALASWVFLHEAREDQGNHLHAVACAQGLLEIDSGYAFGKGDAVREGVFDLDVVNVVGGGALCAFQEQRFIYSWFMCTQAGYGLGLDPESDSFLFDLMELLSQMLE